MAALLWLAIPATQAQVTVDVRIDSMQLFIGQQTGITLDITCDASQHPILPVLQERGMLTPGVEVVKILPTDTTLLNEGKRMQLTQRYIVTSFDSSLYYLPPMEVLIDTTHYRSKALALRVYTVPVDTVHLDEFFGIKDIQSPPFSWHDWKKICYGSLVITLLLLLISAMLVWLKQGNPIIRIVRRKVKLPAHQVAMNQIDRIKQERLGTQEDSKEYYTELTDTLRTYIQERYGFRAMDMTSSEIIDRLMQESDQDALEELRQLFQTADLVKFAKYNTLINENDANLVTAINYINTTKLEVDPNQKPEEPEYTPDQIRSIGMKWTLRILITVCSLVVLLVVVLIVLRLIDLLS